MPVSGGGNLYGVSPPPPMAGLNASFPPTWGTGYSGILTASGGVLYYTPYYFTHAVQFTGLRMYNTGSGDNGDKLRVGAYQMDRTTGLPSTLIIDAGEITLTGAASVRSAATAFTPPYVGWGFLCAHVQSNMDVLAITARIYGSSVGMISAPLSTHAFGVPNLAAIDYTSGAIFGGYTVTTAYGALAASAVAPTSIVTSGVMVAPYRT